MKRLVCTNKITHVHVLIHLYKCNVHVYRYTYKCACYVHCTCLYMHVCDQTKILYNMYMHAGIICIKIGERGRGKEREMVEERERERKMYMSYSRSLQIRFYSLHSNLDNSQLLHQLKSTSPIIRLNVIEDLLVLASRDCHMSILSLKTTIVPNKGTHTCSTMHVHLRLSVIQWNLYIVYKDILEPASFVFNRDVSSS